MSTLEIFREGSKKNKCEDQMHSFDNFYFWPQPAAEILHTSKAQDTEKSGGFASNK